MECSPPHEFTLAKVPTLNCPPSHHILSLLVLTVHLKGTLCDQCPFASIEHKSLVRFFIPAAVAVPASLSASLHVVHRTECKRTPRRTPSHKLAIRQSRLPDDSSCNRRMCATECFSSKILQPTYAAHLYRNILFPLLHRHPAPCRICCGHPPTLLCRSAMHTVPPLPCFTPQQTLTLPASLSRGLELSIFSTLLGLIQKWILTFECFLQLYSVFLFSRFFETNSKENFNF